MAFQNLEFKEQEKQKEIEASKLKYQNRYKMYSLLGILFTVLAIAGILYRNNRYRQSLCSSSTTKTANRYSKAQG
jgi:hypothetical protein